MIGIESKVQVRFIVQPSEAVEGEVCHPVLAIERDVLSPVDFVVAVVIKQPLIFVLREIGCLRATLKGEKLERCFRLGAAT